MKLAKVLCVILILTLLSGGLALAQDSLNVTTLGRWAFGPTYGVTVSGNYAYIGTGGYLEIFDIDTDPDNPAFEGRIPLVEPLKSIAVSSGYAFIADGESGLQIIDVSTPASPVFEGSYNTTGTALDVAVNTNYAYIADGLQGLRVIDVTTPSSPAEAGYYEMGGEAYGIAYATGFVYVICKDENIESNNCIRIFDVSDPANIDQVDIWYDVYRPRDIAIDIASDYAYVADSTGLRSVSITDDTNPAFAAGDFIGGAFWGSLTSLAVAIDATGGYAYVTNSDSIHMVDIGTPATLADEAVDGINGTGHCVALDMANNRGYLGEGLVGWSNFVVEHTTPLAPAMANWDDDPGYGLTRDIAVLGDYAYTADVNDGIYKIDISTPSAPAEDSHNFTDYATATANGVDVEDGYLYVAAGSDGLNVYAVTDITTLVGNYDTNGLSMNVDAADTLAFVADGTNGLVILDISDPANPDLLSTFDSFDAADDNIRMVKVQNQTAYVAVAYKGMWIIDVSDPENPTETGHVNFAGQVFGLDVDVMETYVYVADGTDGLQVISISNPSFPSVIATLNTSGSAKDVAVSANYAYVADGTYGLRVINIFDPLNPQEVGYYNTGDEAFGIFLEDYVAYVTDDENGFYIMDNTVAHPTFFTTANGYDVVDPTGRSIPVVINSASIMGKDLAGLEAGDEFAIFDGDTVVGRGVYEGRFPLPITVWMRYAYPGTVLPGAWDNSKMIFKIWNKSSNNVLGAEPSFSMGDGTFREAQLLTVVSSLVAYELDGFTPVDPTGFSQVITILNISINDNPISPGDEVSVYDDLVCVGAAEYQGLPMTLMAWLETTTPNNTYLPGARQDSSMTFKIYRQSDGVTYLGRPTYAVGSTGTFGETTTTVTDLSAFTYVTQEIIVRPNRLNLIAFNIDPLEEEDREIATMLDDIETLLVCQDDSGNYFLPGVTPVIDQIEKMDPTNGYQLYFTHTANDTVINEGFVLIPQYYSQIFGNTQFYMIGYPYQLTHMATDVFAAISPALLVLQDDDGLVWIPDYGINTIDLSGGMQPGKGYKIFLKQPANYSYPALPDGLAKRRLAKTFQKPKHFNYRETGLSHPLVITGSETLLEEGDEIGVFSGDLCVGAVVYEGEFPLSLPAWGGLDLEDLKAPGYTKGDPISFRLWRASEKQVIDVTAHFENKKMATFGTTPVSAASIDAFEGEALPTQFNLHQNYPNPFNPSTTIRYELPEAGRVTLSIYNMLGQRLRVLVEEEKEAGRYTAIWDGRDVRGNRVGSGLYIVRMRAGSFRKTMKMTLIQ